MCLSEGGNEANSNSKTGRVEVLLQCGRARINVAIQLITFFWFTQEGHSYLVNYLFLVYSGGA